MEHKAVDILIIGSGASGAAVAWRLSDAGFSILCLEQGGWQKPEEYSTASANWEFRAASSFSFNPERPRPAGGLSGERQRVRHHAADVQRGRRQHDPLDAPTAPRFHPSDFRVKILDGVADDWPITYADLEPYYDLNDAWMGCSGIAGDPANPPRSPRPMPPLPLGPDGERIARGFDRLGWHWWPSDSYINSSRYRGRAACNNCGPCGLGCPTGAPRARPTSPTGRAAIANGVELRTGARVLRDHHRAGRPRHAARATSTRDGARPVPAGARW